MKWDNDYWKVNGQMQLDPNPQTFEEIYESFFDEKYRCDRCGKELWGKQYPSYFTGETLCKKCMKKEKKIKKIMKKKGYNTEAFYKSGQVPDV